MGQEDKELIKQLIVFEKEEADLISLYRVLAEAGVAACLPEKRRHEYRTGLAKLHADSLRHKRLMGGLLAKYQKLYG
jgi:hypothetical protein